MNDININISIEDLALLEKLSARTLNICIDNSLSNLNLILEYYIQNETFLNLRNCGRKSNEELFDVCKKYEYLIIEEKVNEANNTKEVNFKSIINSFDDSKIESLNNTINLQYRFLSNRVRNALSHFLRNRIDLASINNEILSNPTFRIRNIKNIGKGSEPEIISFINTIKEHIISLYKNENVSEKINNTITTSLAPRQKALINNFILSKFDSLSVRTKNGLLAFLNNAINITSIDKHIYSNPHFNVLNIENLGVKSEKEIKHFLSIIKEQTKLVVLFDDDEIFKDYFASHLNKLFREHYETISLLTQNTDFNNGIPIFKTIQLLAENAIIIDNNERTVFFDTQNYYVEDSGKEYPDTITKKTLSRERYRQIRVNLFKKWNRIIKNIFTKEFDFNTLNTYGITSNDNFIYIDENIFERICKNENVSFTKYFTTYLISVLLNNTHTLIGSTTAIFSNKRKNTGYISKNLYIVSNTIASMFDFHKLLVDINTRLTSKIDEDYELNFHSYLLNFFYAKTNYDELDIVSEICETLLFNEFELTIGINETIIFKRNNTKNISEYIVEVLEEFKKPMTIYEMYDIISVRFPNLTKSLESLRGSCQRESSLIYFGRSSTYGLKSWEKELNVKGGTIRDIAQEYLEQQDEPKHIEDIAKYVTQYRKTNSKNIYYNLKMEANNRFVFYSGLVIGLKTKKYNSIDLIKVEDKERERKRSWEENFQLLSSFTQKNNRLPSPSGSIEELKLYRFMNIQMNKIGKELLDSNKTERLQKLLVSFNYVKRLRKSPSNYKHSFLELKQFVIDNERLPNPRIDEESKLYHFYYRQSKLYKQEKLTEEQNKLYIEVYNLINTKI